MTIGLVHNLCNSHRRQSLAGKELCSLVVRGKRGINKGQTCKAPLCKSPQTSSIKGLCTQHLRYGLTGFQIRQKFQRQNGACQICKRPFDSTRMYAIDHDHVCCEGTSRGVRACGKCCRDLLCRTCNMAIGLFQESSASLAAAADYVDYWRKKEKITNED